MNYQGLKPFLFLLLKSFLFLLIDLSDFTVLKPNLRGGFLTYLLFSKILFNIILLILIAREIFLWYLKLILLGSVLFSSFIDVI